MTLDIATRRAELEGQLHGLEQARGTALLDGGKHAAANKAIENIKAELESLIIAEGISADRQRGDSEKQRLARLAAMRSELAALEQERLQAVERAEMAARNMVDALNSFMDITGKMAAISHRINNDGPVPISLQRNTAVGRMSTRLASILATLKGCPHRFGNVSWLHTGMIHPQDSWAEREMAALKSHLEPLIQGAIPAPRETLLQIEHQKEDTIHVNGSSDNASKA